MNFFYRIVSGLLGLFAGFLGVRALNSGHIRYGRKLVRVIFEQSSQPAAFWALVLLHFAGAVALIYLAFRRNPN